MITDAILKVVLVIAKAVFGLFPSWTMQLPQESLGLVTEMSKWNQIIPFTELMQVGAVVSTFLTVSIAVKIAVKVFDWITNVIP